MLPFLKNKDDGVGQGPVETVERKPDDDSDYALLDAVAEDILKAIEKKDAKGLKSALSSLCDYIQDQDTEQDEQSMGDDQ